MNVLLAAARHLVRPACVSNGHSVRYCDLLAEAAQLSQGLKDAGHHTKGSTVAIMAPPGRQYVEGTWASWLNGQIAVPLCLSHPPSELQYVLENSQSAAVLTTEEYADKMAPLVDKANIKLHLISPHNSNSAQSGMSPLAQAALSHEAESVENMLHSQLDRVSLVEDDGALIVYTSGTTGRPKGALHTHKGLRAQIEGLCKAWAWQAEDRILHALPLHHVHGIINALYCAHHTGACVEFLPKFSPDDVWAALKRQQDKVTVYMGVPTMYSYLLSKYDAASPEDQQQAKRAAAGLRLTVSGSAACPIPIMNRWEQLSGEKLLERYGMTETGMVVSNPLKGERRPGSVGQPLPGVSVKVAPLPAEADEAPSEDFKEGPGELLVRGDILFKEYWQNPEATAEAFDPDGWFRTGDTAALQGNPPYWRILGRSSVDIIKSGGYKISALDIENKLLQHPDIEECAVVGVDDETQGQVIAAVIACKEDALEMSLQRLQDFASKHLPPYQVPKVLKLLESIPRNAMGKINKKALVKELFGNM